MGSIVSTHTFGRDISHRWGGPLTLRGQGSSVGLLSVLDGTEGLVVDYPTDVPEEIYDPRITDTVGQSAWEYQLDALIGVDGDVAICIGWLMQDNGASDFKEPDQYMYRMRKWHHRMWAIDRDGNVGPSFSLGARVDEQWFSNSMPDYIIPSYQDLVFPAHFGVPMGSRKVRLVGVGVGMDTVVTVGADLALTTAAPVVGGADFVNGAVRDPLVQNGHLIYTNNLNEVMSIEPDGSRTVIATMATDPLSSVVDLGTGASYAWLEGTLDAPQLAVAERTGAVVRLNIDLSGYYAATDTHEVDLAQFRVTPARDQLLIFHRADPISTGSPDGREWVVEVLAVSLFTGRRLTDWVRIWRRADAPVIYT